MGMITVMKEPKSNFPRDLEDDWKMFFRSIPEVSEALGSIVSRVGPDKSIRFKGRYRPKRAQVANAVFLYVASLPVEEQREILRSGIAMLNDYLRLPAEEDADSEKAPRPSATEPEIGVPRSPERTTKRKGAG